MEQQRKPLAHKHKNDLEPELQKSKISLNRQHVEDMGSDQMLDQHSL